MAGWASKYNNFLSSLMVLLKRADGSLYPLKFIKRSHLLLYSILVLKIHLNSQKNLQEKDFMFQFFFVSTRTF